MPLDADFIFKTHGNHQLELLVNYPLDAEQKKGHLELDVYFFIPRRLGINSKSWSVDKFYQYLSVYTRYKTPAVPLKQLLKKNCQNSPLFRIRKIFKKNGNYYQVEHEALLIELRSLLNIIEHHNNCLKKQLIAEGSDSLQSVPDEMKQVQIALDDMSSDFLHPDSAAGLKQGYELCREGISLQIEKAAGRLYEALSLLKEEKEDGSPGKALKNAMKSCIQHIREQQDYRRFHAFCSPDTEQAGRNTEEALYREHEIKKWGQQALYLTSESSSLISRMVQLLFGVAAAIAMSVAVTASLLSLKFFESGSLAWALIAVSAYILKDRIKDGLRAFFLRFIPNIYADRMKRLINPSTGKRGGLFKDRLRFPVLSELSPEVQRSRIPASQAESILHYRKKTKLKSIILCEEQQDVAALSDILRLDISSWLNRMDKAVETVYSLDNDSLNPVEVSRTYRIPALVSLNLQGEALPLIRSYLIVLDSRGIKRIEESNTV